MSKRWPQRKLPPNGIVISRRPIIHVEIFSLCDAATNQQGKLNILGTFDAIWAKQVPVVFQQCSIALRIRFESIEEGQHSLAINFVNFDGKHIVPGLKGTIQLRPQAHQKTVTENIVLNLHKIKFDTFGEYSVDLAIDEKHLSSIPLYVVEQPNTN